MSTNCIDEKPLNAYRAARQGKGKGESYKGEKEEWVVKREGRIFVWFRERGRRVGGEGRSLV